MFVVTGNTWRMWDQIRDFHFIYCDNQSTIWISTDSVQRQWTKHVDIHMHYIKELVHDGTIALLYCAFSEEIADIFTKVFCEKNFSNIKSLLGIFYHVVKNDLWQYFQNFVFLSMFKAGFSHWFFASFLGCMDMQFVKVWLILVSRPYNFLIFTHKFRIKGGS